MRKLVFIFLISLGLLVLYKHTHLLSVEYNEDCKEFQMKVNGNCKAIPSDIKEFYKKWIINNDYDMVENEKDYHIIPFLWKIPNSKLTALATAIGNVYDNQPQKWNYLPPEHLIAKTNKLKKGELPIPLWLYSPVLYDLDSYLKVLQDLIPDKSLKLKIYTILRDPIERTCASWRTKTKEESLPQGVVTLNDYINQIDENPVVNTLSKHKGDVDLSIYLFDKWITVGDYNKVLDLMELIEKNHQFENSNVALYCRSLLRENKFDVVDRTAVKEIVNNLMDDDHAKFTLESKLANDLELNDYIVMRRLLLRRQLIIDRIHELNTKYEL